MSRESVTAVQLAGPGAGEGEGLGVGEGAGDGEGEDTGNKLKSLLAQGLPEPGLVEYTWT